MTATGAAPREVSGRTVHLEDDGRRRRRWLRAAAATVLEEKALCRISNGILVQVSICVEVDFGYVSWFGAYRAGISLERV